MDKTDRETKENTERPALEHPAVALTGAFALGLASARFLRATAEREQ